MNEKSAIKLTQLQTNVDGIDTTIPLFRSLLDEEDIQNGAYNIHWLEKWLDKKFGQNT